MKSYYVNVVRLALGATFLGFAKEIDLKEQMKVLSRTPILEILQIFQGVSLMLCVFCFSSRPINFVLFLRY